MPVPLAVLDVLAPLVAGTGVKHPHLKVLKRPHLKVRSWTTHLLQSSLCIGSWADGIYMHGAFESL